MLEIGVLMAGVFVGTIDGRQGIFFGEARQIGLETRSRNANGFWSDANRRNESAADHLVDGRVVERKSLCDLVNFKVPRLGVRHVVLPGPGEKPS